MTATPTPSAQRVDFDTLILAALDAGFNRSLGYAPDAGPDVVVSFRARLDSDLDAAVAEWGRETLGGAA